MSDLRYCWDWRSISLQLYALKGSFNGIYFWFDIHMPNFQGGKKKDLARSWAFCDHKRQDAIGRVQINVNDNYSHPNSPFAQTRILETFFLVLDKSICLNVQRMDVLTVLSRTLNKLAEAQVWRTLARFKWMVKIQWDALCAGGCSIHCRQSWPSHNLLIWGLHNYKSAE